MVGATVLGVFLQSLPPDRRVAMARVASLIRRAARGVRESKRLGLVFYELSGSPLFALESREKCLTLYVAENSIIEPFVQTIKGFDAEHSLINFMDLNRLPLPDIEKLVRASVVARRNRGTVPSETDLLKLWGVKEENATVAPPIVRISMRTQEEEAAEAAEKANPQAAVSIYLFIYLLFLISHYIISHTEGLIFIPFLCFSPASISNFTISGCFSA